MDAASPKASASGAIGPSDVDAVQRRALAPAAPVCQLSSACLHRIIEPCVVSRRPLIGNWGGSFVSRPQCLFAPSSVEQCCALIELARRIGNVECRAVGRSHSPGDIVFTDGWLIQMASLSGLLAVDTTLPSITVLAGTYLSDVHHMLESAAVPLAMPNVGSISEQTIGGLIATATHGTGLHSPVLSTSVLSLRIVCALDAAQGGTTVVTCSRAENAELFNATLCGLGATGLIVEVTLAVDHWFKLKQISEECPFDTIFGPSTSKPSVLAWEEGEHVLPFAVKRANGAANFLPRNHDRPQTADSAAHADATKQSDGQQHVTPPAKQHVNLGHLLAHRSQHVPACPSHRLPTFRSPSAQTIYPLHMPSDFATASTDPETADAQHRLEELARSSQHVRLAWVPQAGMITVMRMNRTLDPIQTPGLAARVYANAMGYHLLQVLFFLSRYRPSMVAHVNTFGYWLTHPSSSARTSAPAPVIVTSSHEDASDGHARQPDVTTQASASCSAFCSDAVGQNVAEEIDRFGASSFDPAHLTHNAPGRRLTVDPVPIDPSHARSVLVDAAPRVFNVDCLFRQYTNEWAIPLSCAAAALRTMRDWLAEEDSLASAGEHIHFPVEVRFVDADGIWLSPCQGRKTCYIGIVQYRPYNRPVRYRTLFAKFETLMRHFGGRPHWAKAHTCGPSELLRLYPDLPKYLTLRQSVDPDGVFLNPYIRRHLLGEISSDVSPRKFKSRL